MAYEILLKIMKWCLIAAALVYGCVAVILFFSAESAIFQPPKPGYEADQDFLWLTPRSGGKVAAIHLPAQPGKPTFLISSGNAEDLGSVEHLARRWHARGFGVLAYDFPGYGHSAGHPSERGCYEAIGAAWDHLTSDERIDPGSIVIVGRSVGGGPSVWLAERHQPAGLVLISPFTSVYGVVMSNPIFPGDRFPNLKRIPRIKCPLLIIHGTDDSVIPDSHGKRLLEAATVSDKHFMEIPGAGHNDLFSIAGDEIDGEIQSFSTRISAQ